MGIIESDNRGPHHRQTSEKAKPYGTEPNQKYILLREDKEIRNMLGGRNVMFVVWNEGGGCCGL
jgi:hypothetical protein